MGTFSRGMELSDDTGLVLLDTGALDGDYISQAAVDRFRNFITETTCCATKVCSATNSCVVSKSKYQVFLKLPFPSFINNNEVTTTSPTSNFDDNHLEVELIASLLPASTIDIIIGRKSINKYKLLDIYRAHLDGSDMIPRGSVQCDLRTLGTPKDTSVDQSYTVHSTNFNRKPSVVLQIKKDQLIDLETDNDHCDPYFDKYDLYNNIDAYTMTSKANAEIFKQITDYHAKDKVSVSKTDSNINTHESNRPTGSSHQILAYLDSQDVGDNEDANSVDTDYTETGTLLQEHAYISGESDPSAILDNDPIPRSEPYIYGPEALQNSIRQITNQYKNTFRHTVFKEPARVEPLVLHVDINVWHDRRNVRRHRVQSVAKEYAIRKFVNQALADGVIEPSQSEYVSQVLLTPKPNGTYRFCIDYRALNQATNSMSWPLPRIKEMLTRIGLKQPILFGVLDLTQGYYQCPLARESRAFTSFTTFMGTYQWTRVAMGLKGAPSYFQQMMAHYVLQPLIGINCEIYIDDIIIWGSTEQEFLNNLKLTLIRLRDFNISLNPEKGKLGLTEVEYVGHVLNQQGLSFSRKKIENVITFRVPNSHKDLKSFLGLTGYFRDHIKDYGSMVHELQNIVKPYQANIKIKWTEEQLRDFRKLQKAIEQCPTLFFIDYNAPIYLYTDASDYGIGAYLYQLVDDTEQPIAFLSKTLNSTELKWSTPEKEAFAIFYAITKLEYLLRDIHFNLKTDHRNLTFINESVMPKVQRWKLAIQHFDFIIEHVPGKDNPIADGFSRFCPLPTERDLHIVSGSSNLNESALDLKPNEKSIHFLSVIQAEELLELSYFRLPIEKFTIIAKVHNSTIGHHGVERTLAKLQNARNTWKGQRRDIRKFILQCPFCQKMNQMKTAIHTHPFTTASYSMMDRVAIDTIGPLPADVNDNKYIIVAIDCFSRYIELYPSKDTTALTAATALYEWASRYGIPSQIKTDNGTQYNNRLIAAFCALYDIDHDLINAYSHEENGLVERANRSVLGHLKAIIFDKNIKNTWSSLLPMVRRIMNSMVHSAIGVSPADLLYGKAFDTNRIQLPVKTNKEINESPVISDIPPNYATFMDNLIKQQDILLDVALRTQREKDSYHILSREGHTVVFPINSYVLQKYENDDARPPHKLNTTLRGPHKVVAYHRERRMYTVSNLSNNKLEDFHELKLQPFYYDPEKVDPYKEALKDTQSNEVEAVVSHTGNERFIRSLKFKVKWVQDNIPTIEPWQNLRDNTIVHQYLIANNLRKLIPAKYRSQYIPDNI